MRDLQREEADKYQDFFNLMSKEHGLTLTVSEMDEIISEAQATVKKLNKPDVSGRSELLMDFSKFSCTEEYWEENGKIEAQEQIGAYLKYINSR